MLVVGDIGGTKTAMTMHAWDGQARVPRFARDYHSRDFPDLDSIVRLFIAESGETADAGCFDVAGPVVNGQAHITNLPWMMDEVALAASLGLQRVVLMNDLKAVAYAIPSLGPGDYETLNSGEPEPHGPIAVIAPGTGLGEAFLIWDGQRYVACASEGGHASFAPSDAREAALWRYWHDQLGAVSWERVCSGLGIANIYDFLRAEARIPESPSVSARLATAADRTPIIAQAAQAGDPLAMEAMDMFVGILGAEAGNLALKVMATGGVYMAGGVPARVMPLLRGERFLHAFTSKGRLSAALQRMPVHVVTVPAALFGAAQFGFDTLRAP